MAGRCRICTAGPARVLVPGFVGSASPKWIDHISALGEEFDGFYMKSNYTAPRVDDDKEIYSLHSLEVKSLIVAPDRRRQASAGRTTVWGWAWAGRGRADRHRRVHGRRATLGGGQVRRPGDRYSWRKWEFGWDATAGTHTLMARASDSLGRVQPTARAFNRLGYRWNVIHAVKVDVA